MIVEATTNGDIKNPKKGIRIFPETELEEAYIGIMMQDLEGLKEHLEIDCAQTIKLADSNEDQVSEN